MDLCLRAVERSFMRRFVPLVLSIVLLGARDRHASVAARILRREPRRAAEGRARVPRAARSGGRARDDAPALRAPHHLGSPQGAKNAEWILGGSRAGGSTRGSRPSTCSSRRRRSVSSSSSRPDRSARRWREPALAEDPTSSQTAEQLPTYNAYSIDGDVTAPLVYVNYGVPEDYEALERLGIDVKGKIVIARYGGSWRGIKPKVAAEHGAVGCLIYSDPRDDGYFAGRRLSEGRRSARARRRSAASCSTCRSTPATRSRPASARRRTPSASTVKDAATLTKIPVLPISYADAQPLLARARRPGRAGGAGAARCRSPTTSARARRRCTSSSRSTGSSCRRTT